MCAVCCSVLQSVAVCCLCAWEREVRRKEQGEREKYDYIQLPLVLSISLYLYLSLSLSLSISLYLSLFLPISASIENRTLLLCVCLHMLKSFSIFIVHYTEIIFNIVCQTELFPIVTYTTYTCCTFALCLFLY